MQVRAIIVSNEININQEKMFTKFKKSELFILVVVLVLIFISEYIYLVQENFERAVFIGLWPPTIIGFLVFFNLKLKK